MPWEAKDAESHTKHADTDHKRRQWAAVANAALKSGQSEGAAIRQANAAIRKWDGLIDRSAFLYMDPKPPVDQFAQCGTCFMWTGTGCLIHGPLLAVGADDSCGLYVHGAPTPEAAGKEFGLVTPQESGFVHWQVRCENCKYGGTDCALYVELNSQMPDVFNLQTAINSKGCCNAFTQKGADMEKSELTDKVVKYLLEADPKIAALVRKESLSVGDAHVATALGNQPKSKKISFAEALAASRTPKKVDDPAPVTEVAVKTEFPIKVTKIDADQQKILGWASVCMRGGNLIVDKQGDVIMPDDLEKAAHDYVLYCRSQGDMHQQDANGEPVQVGRVIESCVFTPDKLAKGISAIDPDTGEQLFGWFVGFKVDDPRVWDMHKRGQRPEFSIGGTGRRAELE